MKRWLMVAAAALALAAMAQMTDTAETLWKFLQNQGYQLGWRYVPGKPAGMYEGGAPHGAILRTFTNDIAYDALAQKKFPLPDGAIVVKENYTPGGKLAAITVMRKIKGFNPEGGDWFWAKYAPDGSVQASGKVGGCIGRHVQKKNGSDWIFSGNE